MIRPGCRLPVVATLALLTAVAAAGAGCGHRGQADRATTNEVTDERATADGTTNDRATTDRPFTSRSAADGSERNTEDASNPADESDPTDKPGQADQTDPVDRPWPTSGPEMAAALSEAELAIRDPAVSDAEASAWGWRQQQLYRMLVDRPDWVEEALDLADPALRRAAELNWEAQEHLVRLGNSHGDQPFLPAWRIKRPTPAEELLEYYQQGEAEHGIDWTYLAAINLVETRMGRIEGLSTAGAVGPMQFLPTTWAECCDGDVTDPADAIPGAARYLVARGGPDNMERALWGYNNSDNYVGAITAYATAMADDELAYRGYHGWEVIYRSTAGVVHIPVGYEESEPIPSEQWVAENPQRLLVLPN